MFSKLRSRFSLIPTSRRSSTASTSRNIMFTDHPAKNEGSEVAIFSLGCFWGPEAQFRGIKGITRTAVGYIGGKTKSPTYKTVCARDGHTEAVLVEFDPDIISYPEILQILWGNMGGVSGAKRKSGGAQYKYGIWCTSEQQSEELHSFVNKKCKDEDVAKTVLKNLENSPGVWWMAEDYHQGYFSKMGGRF